MLKDGDVVCCEECYKPHVIDGIKLHKLPYPAQEHLGWYDVKGWDGVCGDEFCPDDGDVFALCQKCKLK
jgi:hypothetical protein